MKRFFKLLPALAFLAMVFAVIMASIFNKDKTYSSAENRMLQQMPKLSAKRVLNGRFQKKYEKYLSDQFPARDLWVRLQTGTEIAFGKKEANGVFFGKDGYLLEKYTEPDIDNKRVDKNINALKKFVKQASKVSNVKVMMVPSKTYTLDNMCPPFAETYNEEIFYNKLEKSLPEDVIVPVYDILHKHNEEYIFYRTDHHWTVQGAWYGYSAYLDSCGISQDIAESKKNFEKISDDFLGTTHSKINIYTKKDELNIYEPQRQMKVVYNMGEKTEDTFYQKEFLKKKDKYSVFFGGNQALLEISGGAKNKRTLLVIKDSFANCMVPFLAEDYGKVIVADLRHLNVGMQTLLRSFKPADILVLYNTIQFMQDKEFAIKG